MKRIRYEGSPHRHASGRQGHPTIAHPARKVAQPSRIRHAGNVILRAVAGSTPAVRLPGHRGSCDCAQDDAWVGPAASAIPAAPVWRRSCRPRSGPRHASATQGRPHHASRQARSPHHASCTQGRPPARILHARSPHHRASCTQRRPTINASGTQEMSSCAQSQDPPRSCDSRANLDPATARRRTPGSGRPHRRSRRQRSGAGPVDRGQALVTHPPRKVDASTAAETRASGRLR